MNEPMTFEEASAWKAQQEANRDAYLRRRHSESELIQMRLDAMRHLMRLRPGCKPTVEDFERPPGGVKPANAAELIAALLREVNP